METAFRGNIREHAYLQPNHIALSSEITNTNDTAAAFMMTGREEVGYLSLTVGSKTRAENII